MIGLNPNTIRAINRYISRLQTSVFIAKNINQEKVVIQNQKREVTFTITKASEYAPISRIDINHYKGGITSINLYDFNNYRISELEHVKSVLAKVDKMVQDAEQ